MKTIHYLRNIGLALAVVFGAGVVAAETAQADFTICNYSRSPIDVAYGYYDYQYEDWASSGWYEFRGGECSTLFTLHDWGPEQYVYVYAESQTGDGIWGGDYYFCAENGAFTIYGYENCKARGFDSYGFDRIDVSDSVTFTYELIE